MPPIIIAAGISAAAGIGGAAIASHSAKSAAKTQADSANRAAALQAQSTRESQAYTQQAMAPYMSLGQFGMGLLTQPGQGPMRGTAPQVGAPAPIPQLPPQMNGGQADPRRVALGNMGFAPSGQGMPRQPMPPQTGPPQGPVQPYGLARFGRPMQAY